MKLLKTLQGRGLLLALDQEYEVTYLIEAYGDANRRSASGSVTGLDLADVMDLQTSSDVKLILSDGFIADIAFLGGGIDGPQSFTVNTRLPGL